jgi:hypothetical protein
MNKVGLVILLFISFIVFSCNENTPTEPEPTFFDIQGENGFVGTVNGTNAFIALLIAGDEAIVYVCNGDEDISEFFRGAINDPTDISLTNSDGAQISGQFFGANFAGNVAFSDGSVHSFTSGPNTGSETGIYRVYGDRAAQDSLEAGWILNSERDERGALRVNSVFLPIPRLRDISDGTSRTLFFGGFSHPIERFFLRRSSTGSFQIIAPNN